MREKADTESLDQLMRQRNLPDTQQNAFKTGFTEGFMKSQALMQKTQGTTLLIIFKPLIFSPLLTSIVNVHLSRLDLTRLFPLLMHIITQEFLCASCQMWKWDVYITKKYYCFWQIHLRGHVWFCLSSCLLASMVCQEPHFSLVKAHFLILVCFPSYLFLVFACVARNLFVYSAQSVLCVQVWSVQRWSKRSDLFQSDTTLVLYWMFYLQYIQHDWC